ncbi:MAG: fibronectin type III domain-containing protein [Bacteroidia bacterium]
MKYIFSFILLIILLSTATTGYATHLKGGDLTYRHLSGNTYEIKFLVYRDCVGSTAPLDDSIAYRIFAASNTSSFSSRYVLLSNSSFVDAEIPNCANPTGICIEKGEYIDTIQLGNDSQGYHISYMRNERNENITNLRRCVNTTNNSNCTGSCFLFPKYPFGMVWYAFVPPRSFRNSSPQFLTVPIPYICVNKRSTFNNNVYDPDGDSLVFSIDTPYSPPACGIAAPTPTVPPFSQVVYQSGYSAPKTFGAATPDVTINPITGDITAEPNASGNYVLAVTVKEYRVDPITKAVTYLGEIRRDLQFITGVCPSNAPPNFVADTQGYSRRLDPGDTICFTVSGKDTTPTSTGSDTVYLSAVGGIMGSPGSLIPPPHAYFPDTLDSFEVSQQFCWTPTCDHITYSSPHVVNFNLSDQGCNQVQKAYSIYVTPPPILKPPRLKCVNSLTASTIQLNWDTVGSDTAFVRYNIYRRPGSSGSFYMVESIYSHLTTTWTDFGITDALSQQYEYLIKSSNLCETEGLPSDTLGTLILSVSKINATQSLLSWTSVQSNFGNYTIMQDTGNGYTAIDSTSDTSYLLSNCNLEAEYRIRARDSSFSCDMLSNAVAAEMADSVAPAIPELRVASTVAADTINLTFTPSPDADARLLIFASVNGGVFSAVDTLDITSFSKQVYQHVPVSATTDRYCYYIQSLDSCGNFSLPSDTHCVVQLEGAGGQRRAHLNWHPYSGFPVAAYILERWDGSTWRQRDSLTASDTSFNDLLGARCNVPLFYRIKALLNRATDSISYSDTIRVTPFDTVPPAIPKMHRVTVEANSAIHVEFLRVADNDVKEYEIFYSQDGSTFLSAGLHPRQTNDTQVFVHSGIDPGSHRFCYYVQALDSCGPNYSAPSETLCAMELQGQAGNQSNHIQWHPYVGFNIDDYDLERWNGSTWISIASIPPTDTHFVDTPLPCYIEQRYRVRANELGANTFSYSDTLYLTPFDTIAPAAPEMRSVSVRNNQVIDLTWNHSNSPDIDRYIVYRMPAGGSFSIHDTVGLVSSYIDTPSSVINGSWCYAVAALDSCSDNISDLSDSHCSVVLQTDTLGCEQKVVLTWNHYVGWSAGVSNYEILRSKDGGSETLLATVNSTTTTFTDTPAHYPSRYCYRIKATETGSGGEFSFSNQSCESPFEADVPHTIMVTKTVTSTSTGEIEINWEPQAIAEKIEFQRLYYSTTGTLPFAILKDSIPISQTSFLHENLNTKTGEHYYYLVNVDSCENESDSSEIHKTMDLDFAIGQLEHDLNWTPYEGWNVSQYYIQQLLSGTFQTVDSVNGNITTWHKFPAPCNLKITYRVLATDGAGAFSLSDTVENQAIDTIPSDAPKITNVSVLNGNVIQLDFDGSDSLDNYLYDIRRSTNGGPFQNIGVVNFTFPNDQHSYFDTTNTLTDRYCYQVTILDSCLNSTASNIFCPVQLQGQDENLATRLDWFPFFGYPSFNYYVLHFNGNAYDTLAILPQGDTTYRHQPLPCNNLHHYKILTKETGGSRFSFSDSIALIPFDTIKPAAPAVKFATVISSSSVELQWAQSDADVRLYDVFIKSENTPWQFYASVPDDTVLTLTGLNTLDSIYYFRVIAIDSCGPNRSDSSEIHRTIQLQGVAGNLETRLNWSAYTGFSGISKYYIYRYENLNWQLLDSVASSSLLYTDDSLPCNRTQYYRITAQEAGSPYFSISDSIALTPFDTVGPDVPNVRKASVLPSNEVEVVFDTSQVTDVDWYLIYVSTNGGSFVLHDSVSHQLANPLQYLHTGADGSANNYCYYLIAADSCARNLSLLTDTHCTVMLTGQPRQLRSELNWNSYTGFSNPDYVVQRQDGTVWIDLATNPGSGFTDSLVACNVPYTYRIAIINGNDTAFSNYETVTPFDTIPPGVPGLRYVTVQPDHSVKLEWDYDPDSDVKFFDIFRSINGGTFSLINTVEYDSVLVDSPLTAQTNVYRYYVVAIDSCNAANRSAPSDTDNTMLATLTSQECVPLIKLDWNFYVELPEDVDFYNIYRSDDGINFNFIDVVPNSINTYTDSSVSLNNTYCYRIEALDPESGYSSASDTFCMEPILFPLPDTAALISTSVLATGLASGEIEVQWQPAAPADTLTKGYQLYHSTSGNAGTFSLIHDENNLNIDRYTQTGINTETGLNFYSIAAYNRCDTIGALSIIHRPVQLEANNQNLAVELNWRQYQGFVPAMYELERAPLGQPFSTLAMLPASDSGYTDSSVHCLETYSYRIRALHPAGAAFHSFSDTLTVTAFDTIPPAPADILYASVYVTDPATGEIVLEFVPATKNTRSGYAIHRSENGGAYLPVDTLHDTSSTAIITYSDLNLDTENNTYSYFLGSLDSCGNEAAPADTHTVIHLQVQAVNGANLLNWSAYKGWTGWEYGIERRTAATHWIPLDTVTSGVLAFTDSLTKCDTVYTYRIVAYDFSGNYFSFSNQDSVMSFETDTPDATMMVRATVNASGTASGEVRLEWNPSVSADVGGYNIYRSPTGAAPWTMAQAYHPDTFYVETGLNTDGEIYYYAIEVEDSCHNTSRTLSDVHRTIVLEANAGNERVNLAWNSYQGFAVREYQLWRDGSLYRKFDNATFNFTDTSVLCINYYSYTIRAISNVDTTIFSESNVDSAKPTDVTAPRPIYLKAASVTSPNDEITLTWKRSNNFDAKNYSIYRRIQGQPDMILLHTTASADDTSFVDNFEIGESTICYDIRANDYCDNQSVSSNLGCIIILRGAPGALVNHLQWDDYFDWPGGTEEFRIIRSEDDLPWTDIGAVPGNELNYTDGDLSDFVLDYCYQIEAVPNDDGSNSSFSTVLCLHQEPVVHIPNTFSPSLSFGLNDTWGPEGMFIKSFSMEIYNRWGERIFEATGSERWNGLYKGKPVTEGVYMYVVTIRSLNDNVERFEGTIMLIR